MIIRTNSSFDVRFVILIIVDMSLKSKILLFPFLLVVSVGLYCYLGYDTFVMLVGAILAYVIISLLWSALFCRGQRDENGGVEFNLSKVGETILIFYFLGWGAVPIYGLIQAFPVWYVWILPVVISVLSFLRAHEIYANSNDRLVIKDGVVRWWNNDNTYSFKPENFQFELKKTDCVSLNLYSSNIGWHLMLMDNEGKKKSIDLKMLNLNGHKITIERELRKILPKS